MEKKQGKLKLHSDVTITDLPGIYSLSPYSLEEVVARNYLIEDRPDAILNIVDGTNLERNLYLTTQLLELGIPVVVAINMIDIVNKQRDIIDVAELARRLECPVVAISALKGRGIQAAAEAAIEAAGQTYRLPKPIFSGPVEHALAHIEEAVLHHLPPEEQRWYAIKLFERDAKATAHLAIEAKSLVHIEQDILAAEKELDEDAESIITSERYIYIARLLKGAYHKQTTSQMSLSDRIDKVMTNRILALPIFIAIMWLVYTISIATVGDWTVGFMEELFGDIIEPFVSDGLAGFGVADWLVSLIGEGIIGGVGAVLSFVPQMMILFLLLSILEDVGYMARIAFIMDRIFRKFGLSGKSFIPMLIASGCAVPGIMASRTIEQDRDRKMTIMTTGFIPCSAKIPIIGLIAGALFGGRAWVATSAYFIGVGAVIVSGILLKKFKAFAGDPAPFVMELPAYHFPSPGNVLRATWERGWSFIKRAGTIILAASIMIWLLNSLTFEGGFHYIGEGDEKSILHVIGEAVAVVFAPLGFGKWQAAVATMLGLVAKEEVVGVFGSLSSMGSADLALELAETSDAAGLAVIGTEFFGGSALAAYSFMIFNLLCAPCFAAIGAIRREMNNVKWTWAAIGYMTGFAYVISLIFYQLASLISGGPFGPASAAAIITLAGLIYLLLRKNKYHTGQLAVQLN